jgi:hypothetical protein
VIASIGPIGPDEARNHGGMQTLDYRLGVDGELATTPAARSRE